MWYTHTYHRASPSLLKNANLKCLIGWIMIIYFVKCINIISMYDWKKYQRLQSCFERLHCDQKFEIKKNQNTINILYQFLFVMNFEKNISMPIYFYVYQILSIYSSPKYNKSNPNDLNFYDLYQIYFFKFSKRMYCIL